MNILAISYLFPNQVTPNVGIFVLNRLKALQRHVGMLVINPLPWSPAHRLLPRFRPLAAVPLQDRIDGVPVWHPRFLSIPRYGKGIEPHTYSRAVKSILRDKAANYPFDLIDLHWTFPDLPAGVALAEATGKPLLVTLRGKEALHLADGRPRAAAVRNGLARADGIIALSEELAELSRELIGPNNKTFVVRNGVDTERFSFSDQAQARKTLGLPAHERIILSTGSLIFRKGYDLVIAALAEILKSGDEHSKLQLYIVGAPGPEGDYGNQLRKLASELGIPDHVVFVGAVPNSQLADWYNAADVFCLASRGEGSPNVLTEALACGCPAVATDVGSVPEIMASEPGLGACVPANDVAALERGLREVLGKSHDRSAMSLRFRRYDWDWCAEEVMKVYRRFA